MRNLQLGSKVWFVEYGPPRIIEGRILVSETHGKCGILKTRYLWPPEKIKEDPCASWPTQPVANVLSYQIMTHPEEVIDKVKSLQADNINNLQSSIATVERDVALLSVRIEEKKEELQRANAVRADVYVAALLNRPTEKAASIEPQDCTCDIKDLMRSGCGCGFTVS